MTLKQKYEMLKKQKRGISGNTTTIYPESIRIDQWYNKLYNYHESVSNKYDVNNNTLANYYYGKLLYFITLCCYSVIVIFCNYDFKRKE